MKLFLLLRHFTEDNLKCTQEMADVEAESLSDAIAHFKKDYPKLNDSGQFTDERGRWMVAEDIGRFLPDFPPLSFWERIKALFY